MYCFVPGTVECRPVRDDSRLLPASTWWRRPCLSPGLFYARSQSMSGVVLSTSPGIITTQWIHHRNPRIVLCTMQHKCTTCRRSTFRSEYLLQRNRILSCTSLREAPDNYSAPPTTHFPRSLSLVFHNLQVLLQVQTHPKVRSCCNNVLIQRLSHVQMKRKGTGTNVDDLDGICISSL